MAMHMKAYAIVYCLSIISRCSLFVAPRPWSIIEQSRKSCQPEPARVSVKANSARLMDIQTLFKTQIQIGIFRWKFFHLKFFDAD